MSDSKSANVGKFQQVPLLSIEIVERPEGNSEAGVLFFNPRHLSSFTQEKMDALAHSIRAEGLQQPPIVRAIQDKKGNVKYELIAGERRVRSCRKIYDDDLACFHEDCPRPPKFSIGTRVVHKGRFGVVAASSDITALINFEADPINAAEQKSCKNSDVYPTISGRELYQEITCRVVNDCSDERALRLAFTENDKSEPLTIAEEVALVERLEKMGLRQEGIAEMLGSNVTWVSQTANFRRQLPDDAFSKLVSGHMARHVAVSLLSYAVEDRDELFAASVEAEQQETEAKIQQHRELKEELEDKEDLLLAEAEKAEVEGDVKKATKVRRKAATLGNKAEKEAERLQRAKKESGTIKQGHIKQGAAKASLAPKKAKPLDHDDIESVYVTGMAKYLNGDAIDEVTNQIVPAELAEMVRRTALAIIGRKRDALQPIRDYMIENDKWQKPLMDSSDDDDDFPIEAFNKSTDDFEEAIEDDDEFPIEAFNKSTDDFEEAIEEDIDE
jgi:hypothetical protein